MSKKRLLFAAALIFAAIILAAFIRVALAKSSTEPGGSLEAYNGSDKPFRMLILGHDDASGLTDVMMLASFDVDAGRICVMQIPRDTYAEYADLTHSKINSAAALLGGEKELCQYLSNAFGIGIDGYLSMDLEGFRRIVDAIGGVEIELDKTLYYNDPEQDLYIYLKKGRQVLDGKKAEMLVRYRSGYARGDLDRLDVQKRFLAALCKDLKSAAGSTDVIKLIGAVIPYVSTDVPLPLAVALGIKALSVDDSEISFVTLPGEATVSERTGASYYVMAKAPTERVMSELFGEKSPTVDPDGLFEHSEYRRFREIYGSDLEPDIFYADEFDKSRA